MMKSNKFLYFFLILILFLVSCSVPQFMKPKKVDSRVTPVNADERARKNINEGRGISLKGAIQGRGNTTYDFSTSNPLWRASLETIDFMPLTTVDYSGGIIITDWYNDTESENNSVKITLRFLSNEIRSDSIKVIIHKKNCNPTTSCKINEIETPLKFELQKTILAKAATFEKEDKNKKKKKN